MGQVTLRINGYAHALACADGEEEHLKAMGAEIDSRIAALRQAGLAGGEARMLVVAALQLADELADARRSLAASETGATTPAQAELAATVAVLAARVGRVAERLERDGAASGLETAGQSA
jgi:cell division protein ZapA